MAPVLRSWTDSGRRAGRPPCLAPTSAWRAVSVTPQSHVVGLPADQLTRPGGGGHGGADAAAAASGGRIPSASDLRRPASTGVAGQDGQRLAVDLVARRPPATQVVVVHRRQVVVNAANRRGPSPRHRPPAWPPAHPPRRPPPPTTPASAASVCRCQQAIADRLNQFGGAARRQLGAAVQRRLDLRTKPAGVFGQRRQIRRSPWSRQPRDASDCPAADVPSGANGNNYCK